MSDGNRTRAGQRSAGNRSSSGSRGASGTGRASSRSSGSRGSGRSVGGRSSADRIAAVQNARSRSNSGRSSTARRRRSRRQGPDFAKLLLILIGIVIVVLCVAVGAKSCSRDADETSAAVEETTSEPETEVHAEITVNGISVNGMTKSEAREKILADMNWGMKVSFEGDQKDLENVLAANVDQVLDEAFEKGVAGSYTVKTDGIEEAVAAAVAVYADGWDVKPKNGSIDSFDEASGEFVFAGAQNGKMINRDALAADIVKAVQAGEYQKEITATAEIVEPEITEAEAKASFKRIGTYTTTTTSNKARNENIRIASKALHGKIIQPGETFSFNLTTGNRTTDKGYQAAGAYVNGVLVEEPGGGVCQVSSTLYNAVVFSGLKTTERHAHSYEPSYVTPGEDAMVSYDGYQGPDMKFINNSKTAVGIKTSFSNQKLTISVYGTPILEEGVTLSMESHKTKELDPPAPTYEEDPTLEPGVEVESKKATMGSRWVTNLVTKKDGVVVEEILLHNSTYNGKPATIKRNTSGSVASTEGESGAESSASQDGGQTAESSESTGSQSSSGSLPGTSGPTPGGSVNLGPGDVIEPSAPDDNPASGGPANYPSSPADMTAPAGGGPGSQNAGNSDYSGGPAGNAQQNSAPAGTGLIAPIG